MESIGYYIFCIVAVAMALLLLKKIASCLIKSIVMTVIIAVLVIIYFVYFRQG